MIDAGIHSGDRVIVHAQKTAENGDIIIAMTDQNEVTVKRYFKEDGCIRLQPENSSMVPIFVKEVTIIGKGSGFHSFVCMILN